MGTHKDQNDSKECIYWRGTDFTTTKPTVPYYLFFIDRCILFKQIFVQKPSSYLVQYLSDDLKFNFLFMISVKRYFGADSIPA